MKLRRRFQVGDQVEFDLEVTEEEFDALRVAMDELEVRRPLVVYLGGARCTIPARNWDRFRVRVEGGPR